MPPKQIIHFLDRAYAEYVRSQIGSGHATRTKNALQDLCKLYRSGYLIHPDQLAGIEQLVAGLLYTRANDEKVRRWALNAIAQFGREQFCLTAVTEALKKYHDEPQTAAAAIAALFKLTRDAKSILTKANMFNPQMIALAGLQHVDQTKLDVADLSIDIERADPDQLKLALVVVGLDRAPPNLFHPRHNNRQIVTALGKHQDNIVSQYTVWAITENPHLNISDLGVDIRSIEQQPVNVRAWMFQLLAMSQANAANNWEFRDRSLSHSPLSALCRSC